MTSNPRFLGKRLTLEKPDIKFEKIRSKIEEREPFNYIFAGF